jgi:hypothetical protein
MTRPEAEAARIQRGIAIERAQADPIYALRGHIARLEALDVQVLNARYAMTAAECARLTDKAHYLIGKLKWWIANATPDRAYGEASVWFPAIDDLEKQVAFALASRKSYKDMLAELRRGDDLRAGECLSGGQPNVAPVHHGAGPRSSIETGTLASKVHDTVIDGLIVNAEAALVAHPARGRKAA